LVWFSKTPGGAIKASPKVASSKGGTPEQGYLCFLEAGVAAGGVDLGAKLTEFVPV